MPVCAKPAAHRHTALLNEVHAESVVALAMAAHEVQFVHEAALGVAE